LTSRRIAVPVEGEDRDVDLLHDGREERGRLERAAPLGLEDVAEAVDLGEDVAQRVAPLAPRARNEKSPSRRAISRLDMVCSGLTTRWLGRAANPSQQPRRPGRQRRAHLGRVAAAQIHTKRDHDRGQAAGQAGGEDRLVVGELLDRLAMGDLGRTPGKSYSPYFSRRR
jgi:hypothetical protein